MSKVIYCQIAMFNANAKVIVRDDDKKEEEGSILYLAPISLKQLQERLPALAKQYDCNKIHLIGNNQFVKGIANNLKKRNLEFSTLEIEVN